MVCDVCVGGCGCVRCECVICEWCVICGVRREGVCGGGLP